MKHQKLYHLVLAALFAALTYVATNIIRVPIPATDGYINLGDCVVLLGAFLLGPVYGAAAGGIGSALADILSGYAVFAPGTFVIKALIAVIAAALCAPDGMVVCWCQSNKAPQFVNTKKKFLAAEKVLTFDLDYEPNTILGDIGAHPKVQKGHTEEEMRAIFAPCFRTVKRLEMITKFWYMEAADPIVDPAALAAALDFEFELPYPDGSRMGLSQRAREAFEHRLGIRLPPPTKGEAK